MSRRESRDSHSKRLHSRSEREPSPKLRRDGKPATERTYSSNRHLDIVDTTDRDKKQRRRLQDALPLEAPPATLSKLQHDIVKKDSESKVDGPPDGTKQSSEPMEVPRSQSYFQHDERSSAGHGGRSSSARRPTDHSRRSDPKEQPSDRLTEKAEAYDLPKKDEDSAWRHDGFFELEAEAPPARKRPAFREKKMPADPESAAPAATGQGSTRLTHPDPPFSGTGKREERGGYYSRGTDRIERPFHRADERNIKRGDESFQRGSRERFGGGGMRGRDRFTGRYGERNTHRPGGFQAEMDGYQVEKWKHDLFDEANRSPTPKNEEEQIAKVEALLSL